MSKTFRLCLLLLLAVLLPLRGAWAAAMPCEPTAVVHHGLPAMAGAGHRHHACDEAPATSAQVKCKHCAACVFSPMPFTEAELIPAPVPAAQQFPAWSVAVAAFLSDGLERPPRSV